MSLSGRNSTEPELLSLFSSLYSVFDIISKIHEGAKKDQEKQRIIEELKVPLEEAEEALASLVVNLYTVSGAYFIGYVIEPPHPERVASNLSKDLAESYTNFNQKMKGLSVAFSEHKDELKEILGEDRVLVERFISAFDRDTPDMSRLMADKRLSSKITQTGADRAFIRELGKGLNQYQDVIDVEIFSSIECTGKAIFIDYFDDVVGLIMKVQANCTSKKKKKNIFKLV